jgi:NhaP-type Na+/H+ or K+/H+ antiporter
MIKSGIHSTRITTDYPYITQDGKGLALFDIVFTIIGGLGIAYYYDYNLLFVVFILYILGIILHIIFMVDSPVSNFIKSL